MTTDPVMMARYPHHCEHRIRSSLANSYICFLNLLRVVVGSQRYDHVFSFDMDVTMLTVLLARICSVWRNRSRIRDTRYTDDVCRSRLIRMLLALVRAGVQSGLFTCIRLPIRSPGCLLLDCIIRSVRPNIDNFYRRCKCGKPCGNMAKIYH